MNYSEKTVAALRHAGTSQRAIYQDAGFASPQYFNYKVTKNTLSLADMDAIAHAIGCNLEVKYVFDDGTEI